MQVFSNWKFQSINGAQLEWQSYEELTSWAKWMTPLTCSLLRTQTALVDIFSWFYSLKFQKEPKSWDRRMFALPMSWIGMEATLPADTVACSAPKFGELFLQAFKNLRAILILRWQHWIWNGAKNSIYILKIKYKTIVSTGL